jgi:hypothetical protein
MAESSLPHVIPRVSICAGFQPSAPWQNLGARFDSSSGLRAGLRHARARCKCIGRLRIVLDGRHVVAPRKTSNSWSKICEQIGLSKGNVSEVYGAQKGALGLPKSIREHVPSNPRVSSEFDSSGHLRGGDECRPKPYESVEKLLFRRDFICGD